MSKRTFTKRTVTTAAPGTPDQLKMSQRQRARANRTLLKRRRAKSGQ